MLKVEGAEEHQSKRNLSFWRRDIYQVLRVKVIYIKSLNSRDYKDTEEKAGKLRRLKKAHIVIQLDFDQRLNGPHTTPSSAHK